MARKRARLYKRMWTVGSVYKWEQLLFQVCSINQTLRLYYAEDICKGFPCKVKLGKFNLGCKMVQLNPQLINSILYFGLSGARSQLFFYLFIFFLFCRLSKNCNRTRHQLLKSSINLSWIVVVVVTTILQGADLWGQQTRATNFWKSN